MSPVITKIISTLCQSMGKWIVGQTGRQILLYDWYISPKFFFKVIHLCFSSLSSVSGKAISSFKVYRSVKNYSYKCFLVTHRYLFSVSSCASVKFVYFVASQHKIIWIFSFRCWVCHYIFQCAVCTFIWLVVCVANDLLFIFSLHLYVHDFTVRFRFIHFK